MQTKFFQRVLAKRFRMTANHVDRPHRRGLTPRSDMTGHWGQTPRRAAALGLLLVGMAVPGWPAAYTSTQAGSWSSAATWGGRGVPSAGDSVTIAHAVVADQNAVVGLSGASGTVAVTCQAPGSLTINSGVTFALRGDFLQNNCPITINA